MAKVLDPLRGGELNRKPDASGGVAESDRQGKEYPKVKGAGTSVAPYADMSTGKCEHPDEVYRG